MKEIPENIKYIWSIGARKCKGCGFLKAIEGKGLCERCYRMRKRKK